MKAVCAILLTVSLQTLPSRAFVPRTPFVRTTFHPTTPLTTSYHQPYNQPFAGESRLLAEPTSEDKKSKLPFFLDPGTKGGALFLSLVLFVVPIIFYNIILSVSDIDELDLGRWIGVGFTAVATLAWLGTYLFRVVTKDMTYAKQLKDYENAVIAKRLEELDEDELQALVEEVDKDDF